MHARDVRKEPSLPIAVEPPGWEGETPTCLQLRDNIPNIRYPGKIGLFGGHREGGESFLECIVREVHEELSYYIPPERFEPAYHIFQPDPDLSGGKLNIRIFVAREIPAAQLSVTEGTLKVVAPDDIDGLSEHLTPTAIFALEKFFGRTLPKPQSSRDQG